MPIFVALVIGGIVTRIVLPDPVSPLSKEDIVIYGHGKYFDDFWSKLSPMEQSRIDDIVHGKPVPELVEKDKATSTGSAAKHKHRKKSGDNDGDYFNNNDEANESQGDNDGHELY